MAISFKRPWMGVAIPCFIIAFIGYNAHYFILTNFLSLGKQIFFQCILSMIWLSYYLAIMTNPGRPPKVTKDPANTQKFCKKCETYKPERSHHCKTCNQCVLMMDHHCPWTMNCVGYSNYPQFLRFLFWVIVTTGYLLIQLCIRIKYIWDHRYLRSASYNITTKTELIFLTILTPFDAFILLTIFVLFIRCIRNQIFNGMTQIENWEQERLESLYYRRNSTLLQTLINQVWTIYPTEKTSDHETEAEELLEKKRQHRLRFMTIVNFPYDNGFMANMTTSLGSSPFNWIWPWGGPEGNGTSFERSEVNMYEKGSSLQDIILSLPWPPDGGRRQASSGEQNVEVNQEDGEFVIRNNNVSIDRRSWQNDWGEELKDFGVDAEIDS